MAGKYEQCNEFAGPIKCVEFLERLSDHQLLRKDSASQTYLLNIPYSRFHIVKQATNQLTSTASSRLLEIGI
jgi:hypothetical protein